MNFLIFRKKIKFFLEKYYFPKINQNLIDSDSRKSFSKNIDTAIINLSVIPWNFRYQRPQQLATVFSKKNIPVFYIDNEFSITDNLKKPPFILEAISQNLYSVKFSSLNNYFIYQNLPNNTDIEIISNSLKNLIDTANIKHPILKIDHPFWTPIALMLRLPLIYDCLDNQDNFELNSKEIIEAEKRLFKIVSKVIVTSKLLYDKASKFISKNDITIISNGTNFDHFTNNTVTTAENDISKYPKPIYGYFGAIEKWLDIDFIEKLAKNTKGSIILIGKNNLNYQPNFKNIILLGEKLYKELPQFLSQFDICLLPFKINSLTKAVNPVKIYEYFSQGKAVITSKLPELEQYSKLLYPYSSNTDLNQLLDEISKEDSSLKSQRQTVAQNNTWESKADKIIKVIKSL